jgi:hypothetical protein
MHANITDLFGKISSLLTSQDTVGLMHTSRCSLWPHQRSWKIC